MLSSEFVFFDQCGEINCKHNYVYVIVIVKWYFSAPGEVHHLGLRLD